MQLGMIGLGRMGANIVRRLLRGGHECVVFDVNPDHVGALAQEGATAALSLDEFVRALTGPRVAWVMVPAGAHIRREAAVGDAAEVRRACRASFWRITQWLSRRS